MKYDDASWHYGGDFPKDLPAEAGATHIGMYLSWAILSGLGGSLHIEECPEDLESLQKRTITPGHFLIAACDEKFTDEDLNAEGNAFTKKYFDLKKGQYVPDYEELLAQGLPTAYHIEDCWANFDRLKPILDRRFAEWKSARNEKKKKK